MSPLLREVPRPLVEALRNTRTVALWLAQPVDSLYGLISRREPQPPMWLRRHSGPIWAFDRAAAEYGSLLSVLGLIREGAHVLDVGSGGGSMATEFRRMLGPGGRYTGIDVHVPSVEWCQRHFGDDRRFRFDVLRADTPWSTTGGNVLDIRFPVPDGSVDLVIAKSVFTHFLPPETLHYLGEIRRVLAPGGTAVISAFLLHGGRARPGPVSPMIDFRYGDNGVRWKVKHRPYSAVAYEESSLRGYATSKGLSVERVLYGYWTGSGIAPNAQDLLVLTAPPKS